jgi:hypothetical protein
MSCSIDFYREDETICIYQLPNCIWSQARARVLVQEKYDTLQAEWPEQVQEFEQLLQQMETCFGILEEERQRRLVEEGLGAKDGEGMTWEDVEVNGGKETEEDGGWQGGGEKEGLSAYAAEIPVGGSETAVLEDNLEPSADTASTSNQAVLETLHGLYKQLCSRILPTVREALRTLVRAEAGEPGGPANAGRERLLRAAIELRGRLDGAKERFEALQLDVAALMQRQQERLRTQESEVLREVLGSYKERERQGLEIAPSAARWQEQPGSEGQEGVDNPYLRLVDPAAASQRRSQQQDATRGRAGAPRAAHSSLSAELRQFLAAQVTCTVFKP